MVKCDLDRYNCGASNRMLIIISRFIEMDRDRFCFVIVFCK